MEDRLMKPWEAFRDDERFLQYYVCLKLSESQASHHQLDNSNKVILPVSALDRLMQLDVDLPMMFAVQNPASESFFKVSYGTTHCAVFEFTAEEGYVHMPQWMMSRLGLEEGHLVFFTNSTPLAKGTRIKIQPHKTDFLNLSDHKSVLEIALRNYSCLTTGDAISIVYNDREYMINIVETVPGPAIGLIDTDCEVDFEAPVDYEELMKNMPNKKAKVAEEGEKKKKSKFVGTARRLDGSIVPPPPPPEEEAEPEAEETRQSSRKSGTLVFGPNKTQDKEPSSKKQDKETSTTVEPVKFQAFTGATRTLR